MGYRTKYDRAKKASVPKEREPFLREGVPGECIAVAAVYRFSTVNPQIGHIFSVCF